MELEASKSAVELECLAEVMLHWKVTQVTVSTEDLPLPLLVRHGFAL